MFWTLEVNGLLVCSLAARRINLFRSLQIFLLLLLTFPSLLQVRHSQDLGIKKHEGAVLVGYMAMSQTVGKIVFGRVADHPRVNRIHLYQICLLVCSVLTTLLPVFTTYKALLAYCFVFGFHDGCFVVLIAVLTGDIAGRKKMAAAYGALFFFTGIPMMLGPPVAGKFSPCSFEMNNFRAVKLLLWVAFSFGLPEFLFRDDYFFF